MRCKIEQMEYFSALHEPHLLDTGLGNGLGLRFYDFTQWT
jgi:hypothetical protein